MGVGGVSGVRLKKKKKNANKPSKHNPNEKGTGARA